MYAPDSSCTFLCVYPLLWQSPILYLFREDIMGEDILDAAQAGGTSDDFHAKSSTDQLNDGTQLLHMEVYGHEQQHGTKGRWHPTGPGQRDKGSELS